MSHEKVQTKKNHTPNGEVWEKATATSSVD